MEKIFIYFHGYTAICDRDYPSSVPNRSIYTSFRLKKSGTPSGGTTFANSSDANRQDSIKSYSSRSLLSQARRKSLIRDSKIKLEPNVAWHQRHPALLLPGNLASINDEWSVFRANFSGKLKPSLEGNVSNAGRGWKIK